MRRLIAPLLLFLIVAGFYWKFTLSGQYELMWNPDQATQIVPWLQVAARQWQEGVFPLWDPHMWGGQPLLGQAQPGVAYFLNWILFSVPSKTGYFSSDVFHWYFAAIHYMAALFCYLLCRDLGRSVLASMTGGLVFSLTSYMGATGWPQMLNGAVWAPLVFLFLLRTVRNYMPLSSAAFAGLALGMAWLSGHHQAPLLLTLAAMAAWAFYSLDRGRVNWRLVRRAAIAMAICVFTGALQILPAREYGQVAKRWVSAAQPVGWNDKVPYSVHEMFSLAPYSILGTILPGFASHSETFIGLAAFSLALIAVWRRWWDYRVRLFLFLAVAALLYALGGNTVFQGMLYAIVPLIEKARVPAAAVSLFALGASVLAAFGLDTAARRDSRASLWQVSRMLVWAGVFLMACLFVFKTTKTEFDQRHVLAGFIALLLAGVMAGLSRRALRFRHAAIFLILLVLMEAGSIAIIGARKEPGSDLMNLVRAIRGDRDVAAFLHKQPPGFRVVTDGKDRVGNWAAYHNLDALTGYLASLSSNIASIAAQNRNVQSLWGVRYFVGNAPADEQDRDIYTGESGLKVFERSGAFPRAWIVHRIEQAPSRIKINEAVEQDLGSFAARALMTTAPPLLDSCPANDAATYRRVNASMVVLEAMLACKGLLVVSDTYFPGWYADVDGKPAAIHEVNAAMRGVVVPAGKHTVTMRYRPASVLAGGVLTLLGIVGAIGLWWYERRSGPKSGTIRTAVANE